jgi:excisionase family DNA binding protein
MLKVEDVCGRLGLSRETVWRMLGDGRLAGVKIGRHWRVSEAALDAYLSALPAGPKADHPAGDPDDLIPLGPTYRGR